MTFYNPYEAVFNEVKITGLELLRKCNSHDERMNFIYSGECFRILSDKHSDIACKSLICDVIDELIDILSDYDKDDSDSSDVLIIDENECINFDMFVSICDYVNSNWSSESFKFIDSDYIFYYLAADFPDASIHQCVTVVGRVRKYYKDIETLKLLKERS